MRTVDQQKQSPCNTYTVTHILEDGWFALENKETGHLSKMSPQAAERMGLKVGSEMCRSQDATHVCAWKLQKQT